MCVWMYNCASGVRAEWRVCGILGVFECETVFWHILQKNMTVSVTGKITVSVTMFMIVSLNFNITVTITVTLPVNLNITVCDCYIFITVTVKE